MTPEFIRKYHIYKILNSPLSFGIQSPDGFVTAEDIASALQEVYTNNDKSTLYKGCLKTSAKTIKRDVSSIQDFVGVEIEFQKGRGHCIKEKDTNKDIQKFIFDKVELYMASHKEKEWSPFVSPEKSSLTSEINIIGLIKAIKEQKWVSINYQGWFDDLKSDTDRYLNITTHIQPLHLKECYKAWYLIGYDDKNGVRVYCLDKRMKQLTLTDKSIENPYPFNVDTYFKYSLGVLNDAAFKPEKVVLKVANHHFKYLQTKPLPNQKIISYPKEMDSAQIDYTNPDIWGEMEFFLQPNYEFVMELYKFNLWIKIIEPQWLAIRMASQYAFIANTYYSKSQIKELTF